MPGEEELEAFGRPSALIAAESSIAPFRWHAFRTIWFANLVSALGSMIQTIAAAWLMTDLTSSHLLVALVQASVAIPVLALGVVAGVIADNHDRRLIMLAANCAMFVFAGLLAALTWFDAVQPWSLLLFTVLIGCGFALNGPAWQASVRLQVPRHDIPQAISLNSIAFNAARSLGPAIGGLILTISEPAMAFTINAASYLVMIVALARWRSRPTGRQDKHRILPALAAGINYVATNVSLRKVLARGLAVGIGSIAYQALIPLVAREQIGSDELGLGLVLATFGIGSVTVAFWIGPLRQRFGSEPVVSTAMVLMAASLALLAFANTLPMALGASFLAGAGQVIAMTSLNVSMQMRSPEDILGRCLAIFQALAFGGMALGSWLWGTISEVGGTTASLLAAAAWLLLSLLILRLVAPLPRIGEA